MPWASKHYEPSTEQGRIGPKTNARIFELLLRLRAERECKLNCVKLLLL